MESITGSLLLSTLSITGKCASIQSPYSTAHFVMYSSTINPICHCVSTRYVQAQIQVARQNALPTFTPAGQEVIVGGYSIPAPNPQMEQLIKENERLKREVESYSEKAARLQKVIA